MQQIVLHLKLAVIKKIVAIIQSQLKENYVFTKTGENFSMNIYHTGIVLFKL